MTPIRLTSALIVAALAFPLAANSGEDPQVKFKVECETEHTMTRDFVHFKIKVLIRQPGDDRFRRLRHEEVISRLIDENLEDGNNVVTPRDSDETNRRGVARTQHEFNNFGNYRAKFRLSEPNAYTPRFGERYRFGVRDRSSGECEPPTPGA